MSAKKTKPSAAASSGISRILQAALRRRAEASPQTSIRSLASNLELSSSYLSKVFRGERELTPRLLKGLTTLLQLDHHEVNEIQRQLLVKFDGERLSGVTGLKTVTDTSTTRPAVEYVLLGKNEYWLLEEWFHIPILNLVTTKNFDPTFEEIGRRLGISEVQARQSIESLLAAGYLIRDEGGLIQRSELRLRLPTQRSHLAIRTYHHRVGRRALEELERAPTEKDFEERLISGLSFACDPKKLPAAKVLIEEALYKAAELLSDGDCSEVFQMNLQLFKLTRD